MFGRSRFSAAGGRNVAALTLGALAIALVLACFVLHLRPGPIGESRPPPPVGQDQTSVVTVFTSSKGVEGSGSGFFISSDGRILTNAHVVADADSIRVELPNGQSQRAYRVGLDWARDVAEIYTPYPSRPLTLASGEVPVGASVYVLGNPLGTYPHTTIKGRVTFLHDSAVVDGDAYPDLIDTDAQIFAGNSGGPAVDELGRVTGMLTLGDDSPGSPDGPGNGYLLPNSVLTPGLERWRSLPLPSPATP
jgi:S1-C subfamily serine protease